MFKHRSKRTDQSLIY